MALSRLRRRNILIAVAALAAALPASVAAKDSLGVFGKWGAFRDPSVPRCYAIAKPTETSKGASHAAYVSIGTWPKRDVRGQVHARISRKVSPTGPIALRIDGTRFEMTGNNTDAWAKDRRMDAAIVAAMRSAETMSISARDTDGKLFTDSYSLSGAATAMDAATVGCARVR